MFYRARVMIYSATGFQLLVCRMGVLNIAPLAIRLPAIKKKCLPKS